MRCGEVVTAVLNDPTKLDPWAACIAKVILNVRRILTKSKKRLLQFIETVAPAKKENKDRNTQGPAFAFYRYTNMTGIDIDLDCKATNGSYAPVWLSDEYGERVNLIDDPTAVIKDKLRTWLRRAIMRTLADR